jgi:2-dehydropantoate 2-reductase
MSAPGRSQALIPEPFKGEGTSVSPRGESRSAQHEGVADAPASSDADDPILIWGAGAIGGTLGAYWARAGVPVLMVDIVAEHAAACRSTGLAIEGPVEQFTQVVPALTPDELSGRTQRFSRVVLAVKAHATAAALDALAPFVADDGYVLSAQNGLNELLIAERLGAARTMGCFVNFGADWLGPGRILFGNRAAVVVGEIDGSIQPRTRQMHALLQIFEPQAVLTDNIWGYLWGKLAYGAMLFATALTADSMADNFADPRRFVVFDRLAREVMAVAAARGVKPVGFNGFDPAAFAPGAAEAGARASVAALAEFNRHTAKTHSGIYRDLAVRRRRTEIHAQIGIIAKLGAEVGVATPALTRLVELIGEIEEGRRVLAWDSMRALIDTCSATRGGTST